MQLPSFDELFLWAGMLVYPRAREWLLLGEICRSISRSESIASSSPYPLRSKFVIYVEWSCPGRPSGTLTARLLGSVLREAEADFGTWVEGFGSHSKSSSESLQQQHGIRITCPAGVASGEAGKHHLQLDNLRLMASLKRITGPLSCIPGHSRHQSFRLDRFFGIMASSPPGEAARPFDGTRSISDLTPLRDSLVLAVRSDWPRGCTGLFALLTCGVWLVLTFGCRRVRSASAGLRVCLSRAKTKLPYGFTNAYHSPPKSKVSTIWLLTRACGALFSPNLHPVTFHHDLSPPVSVTSPLAQYGQQFIGSRVQWGNRCYAAHCNDDSWFFCSCDLQRCRDQLLDLCHLSAACGSVLLEFAYCFLGNSLSRGGILVEVFPALHQRLCQCGAHSCRLVRNGHWPINRPLLSTAPHCSRREEDPMDFRIDSCQLFPLPHPSYDSPFWFQLSKPRAVS